MLSEWECLIQKLYCVAHGVTPLLHVNDCDAVDDAVITSDRKSNVEIVHEVQETGKTASDDQEVQKSDEVPPTWIKDN